MRLGKEVMDFQVVSEARNGIRTSPEYWMQLALSLVIAIPTLNLPPPCDARLGLMKLFPGFSCAIQQLRSSIIATRRNNDPREYETTIPALFYRYLVGSSSICSTLKSIRLTTFTTRPPQQTSADLASTLQLINTNSPRVYTI